MAITGKHLSNLNRVDATGIIEDSVLCQPLAF